MIDEEPYPGPSYDPQIFQGGFPIGEVGYPGDLYHSVNGLWYRFQRPRWVATCSSHEYSGPCRDTRIESSLFSWIRISKEDLEAWGPIVIPDETGL